MCRKLYIIAGQKLDAMGLGGVRAVERHEEFGNALGGPVAVNGVDEGDECALDLKDSARRPVREAVLRDQGGGLLVKSHDEDLFAEDFEDSAELSAKGGGALGACLRQGREEVWIGNVVGLLGGREGEDWVGSRDGTVSKFPELLGELAEDASEEGDVVEGVAVRSFGSPVLVLLGFGVFEVWCGLEFRSGFVGEKGDV